MKDQPEAETSDNTKHSKEADLCIPDGIRTLNPNKRVTADPHFKPRGHWDE